MASQPIFLSIANNFDLIKMAVRVSVVGCGRIAEDAHLPSLLGIGGVSTVAVCDLDLKKAESTARKFGIKNAYGSWDEMIRDEKPDLVHVCTTPDSHAEIAINALEAGCHVLVEKPMAVSLSECEAMASAARRSGRLLCIAHNQRFHPCFLRAQRLIRSGELGEPIEIQLSHRLPRASYLGENHWSRSIRGGLILEIMPHPVYLSMALMGWPIGVSSASMYRFLQSSRSECDTFSATLVANKCVSNILVSHGGGSWSYTLRALATEGEVEVDIYNSILLKRRLKSLKVVDKNLQTLSVWAQLTSQALMTSLRLNTKRWLQTHKLLIASLIECILNDRPSPVPPEEGVETIRVCEEISRRMIADGEEGLAKMLKCSLQDKAGAGKSTQIT